MEKFKAKNSERRVQEMYHAEDAVSSLDEWKSQEGYYYSKKDLLRLRGDLRRYCGRMYGTIEIFFDKRFDVATVDLVRGDLDNGRMTLLFLREPSTRRPMYCKNIHRNMAIKAFDEWVSLADSLEESGESDAIEEAFGVKHKPETNIINTTV
jgi:hypothetical protein